MDRRAHILEGLQLDRLVGVEIGPLDKPLVRKRDGVVYYVDHCDTAHLKARWASDANVDTATLHVDAVWGAQTLKEGLEQSEALQGARWRGADYVVASHVIEHVPDLVSWLREIDDVLRPGGTLRLVVPDKRYSFDFMRRTTNLSEVADAFVRKRRVPSGSRVLDFALHMAEVDCAKAWGDEISEPDLRRYYTDDGALALARDAEDNGTYHDVHCWVFTPASFAALMGRLADCQLLEFACESIVPTARNTLEFFVRMRPQADRAAVLRSWHAAALYLDGHGAPLV